MCFACTEHMSRRALKACSSVGAVMQHEYLYLHGVAATVLDLRRTWPLSLLLQHTMQAQVLMQARAHMCSTCKAQGLQLHPVHA